MLTDPIAYTLAPQSKTFFVYINIWAREGVWAYKGESIPNKSTNLYLSTLTTASLVQMVIPAQFDNINTDIKTFCWKREGKNRFIAKGTHFVTREAYTLY